MRIEWDNNRLHYYDRFGAEIFEGDTVLVKGQDTPKKVYLTEDEELGWDATNPKWIESGRAYETQYGIYAFCTDDEVELVQEKAYKGVHHYGEIVYHKGHECKVTHLFNEDGRDGIAIIPTGNYGFEVGIWEEQL